MLRRFLRAQGEDPDTLVLLGRCHPQESIPYRALDGIVDALTRFLVALPPEESGA